MGATTKALRERIRSVDSTMHITKAMEMVASSKIKRARQRMEACQFYRTVLENAFADISSAGSVYSSSRDDFPALYIVIAGDRGLAGGYNNNVFKTVMASIRPGDLILPIGNRTGEFFANRSFTILDGQRYSTESLTAADCAAFSVKIKTMFDAGQIGNVYLASTKFVSVLTQTAQLQSLLPIVPAEHTGDGNNSRVPIQYEPDPVTVLEAILPEYLAGTVYSAVCESYACELAARRAAMDTASKNAQEMIEQLNLQYNRARQSAITQEITEIVAGGEA